MDISYCSFQELPYSQLFKTYTSNFSTLGSFYAVNPFDEKEIKERAGRISKPLNKKGYIEALGVYHKDLGIEELQKPALKKLSEEDALAIVTGQQLGMYGGPLFTIYKTVTTILLAKEWEKKLDRPVVPVFWLADEDHDFEEIARVGVTGRKDYRNIVLEEKGNGHPVSVQEVNGTIESFRKEVRDELYETDFTEALWDQLDSAYEEGKTYARAFAELINAWFSGEGLLIAGSNHPEIKKLLAGELKSAVRDAGKHYQSLEKKSKELDELFHRQVINGDSNLFHVSEEKGRQKVNKKGDTWAAGSKSWSPDELLKEIGEHPERFSPNVFLRPIVQDKLLPTLGYVAGPGEIAYYGQMLDFYKDFDLEMPVIFPRMCATLIESAISRILEKLPFKVCEYDKRIEDLESEFLEKMDTPDLEEIFSGWKDKLERSAEAPLKVIHEIDPTLDGTVGKTVAGFENELDKLKGRVYRSIKKQEEIQINRIEKIKVNLFPDGGLQERALSPVYFMNKYGLEVWEKLLQELQASSLDLSKHYLIEL